MMKGKISKRLEAVLQDPEGRSQLKDRLLHGKDGRIVAGDKSYQFRVDVRTDGSVQKGSRTK
jgi:hypothetical protein